MFVTHKKIKVDSFFSYPDWIKVSVGGKFFRNCPNNKEGRHEMAEKLLNLRKHEYKYLCDYCYCKHEELEDFLKFVKDNNYHFYDIKYRVSTDNDFLFEFHGNLKEISCTFRYIIYDKHYADKVLGKLEKLELDKVIGKLEKFKL